MRLRAPAQTSEEISGVHVEPGLAIHEWIHGMMQRFCLGMVS